MPSRNRQSASRLFPRILILLFCFAFFLGSCAKKPAPPPKPKPSRPSVPGPAEPVPVPSAEETLSPKREASLKMVEMGKEYLEKKETDKAIQTFQEAVNIDYGNGIAYFFLAKALYLNNSFDDSLGLLERAETLLAPYPSWVDEIFKLRQLIDVGRGSEQKQKEDKKEPYY